MPEKLLAYVIAVSRSPGETRAALLAGGEVIEVAHCRDAEIQPGAVYAGRIGARVPGIDAVFVEIGATLPGVLKTKAPPPEGSAMAVTVVVPPRTDKGAELKSADRAAVGAPPVLMTPAPEPALVWWKRYGRAVTRVVCEPQREATRLAEILKDAPVEVHDGNDLFADRGIDEAIEMALRPAVRLPSGGSIIIETTAAVTAIDVNSGASDPATANLEALTAVARELRLRNIAGHMVVDAIPDKRNAALQRLLGNALSDDPVQTRVAGFTPLGMLELARQRLGLSLDEQLLDADGEASVSTIAYACLRQGVRKALREKITALTITAAPDVIAAVQGPLRAALDEAADRLKAEILLKSGPALPRGKFTFAP